MVFIMKWSDLTKKKRRLDRHRPLPDALVRNLDDWLRVELTYTSNALEGNTLTRRETALIVEKGLSVGGKTLVEHLEAVNHAQALDWVRLEAHRTPQAITAKDILHLHALILKGIDDANAGTYRSVPVRISGSRVVLPNPLKVPDLMLGFLEWLQTTRDLHPAKLAAEAHYRLVSIHPFVDGNGRTARLLLNLILLMSGYPVAIIRKRDRLAYVGSLEKAQLGGGLEDYENLIRRSVNRSLDLYLKAVQGETADLGDEGNLLKIGELAKLVGESHSTLRHWTKTGLLEVAEITKAGYQLYPQDTVERIQQIHRLKAQRLTLLEIRERLIS